MHAPSVPSPSLRRDARGSTLVVAVFVIALVATFIGLAFDYTSNTGIAMTRARDLSAAQALANGALEATFKRWQQYMSSKQFSTFSLYATSAAFSTNITTGLMTQLNTVYATPGYTLTTLSIDPVDRTDTLHATQAATYASTGPMPNTPGWVATTYNYRARATVVKTSNTNFGVTVTRYFQQADASLFQAMLFFQNDLELHPGAAMTLYGLVHTNSNLYAATSVSLNFSSNVSYHGSSSTLNPATTHPSNFYEMTNGYVEGVTQTLFTQESGNWTSYKNPTYATSRAGQLSEVQSLDPLGMSAAAAVDPTNGNASGTHEIIERPVPVSATNPNPQVGSTDPDAYAAHRIFNSAGLRIIINRNAIGQKVRVYQPSTTNAEASVEIVPTGSPLASKQNIADQIISAVTIDTTGNIYDFREGRTIYADTVDVSVLTPALNAYAAYNGVVYVTDATNADVNGNTGASDAIRLKKGGILPDAGMTIATDGGIYVQGDFNTGTTYSSDGSGNSEVLATAPVSNKNSDPTQYTVSGYTQKPAAVMGDAVMILSNAWNDTNSSAAIGSRVATPTTMNAAIVSGQVLTNSSTASGGAHNFPRFLENWGSQNFTYHGSMCELFPSTKFTGTYGKSNVYGAPNRRWFFDDSFLSTPPPGNLRSTTYSRGRWVLESKDQSL